MSQSSGPGNYSADGLKPLKDERYFEVGLVGKDELPKKINVTFDKIVDMNNMDREQVLSQAKFMMDIEIKDKILKVEPQVYVLNKEADLDGFKVFIREMRVYPMGTEVVIRKDLGKEQKFTWLKDGYLEDEKGNVFRLNSGRGTEDGKEYVLTFAGGGYNKSKQLTFKARGMFYQSTVDREVIVDRKAGKVIEDGGYGIELLNIQDRGDETQINFKPKENANIENIDLSFSGAGKKYSQWHSGGEGFRDYISEFGVSVDKAAADRDILKFTVTWIHKFKTSSFEIKLK